MNFTVMHEAVEEFLGACGYTGEIRDVAKIEITAQGVTVTQLRRNEGGHLFVINDQVSTVVTTLRVTR